MNQFLNNRYFCLIPLSCNGYPSTIFTDSTLSVNFLIEIDANDKRVVGGDITTELMVSTFIVGSK
jgi:hypothetical protein